MGPEVSGAARNGWWNADASVGEIGKTGTKTVYDVSIGTIGTIRRDRHDGVEGRVRHHHRHDRKIKPTPVCLTSAGTIFATTSPGVEISMLPAGKTARTSACQRAAAYDSGGVGRVG